MSYEFPLFLAWFKPKELDWCGVFALALVRVGRHLEVKAINKAAPYPAQSIFRSVNWSNSIESNQIHVLSHGFMDSWFSHDYATDYLMDYPMIMIPIKSY